MIAEIQLQQYRSYLDKTFSLSEGLNVVVGPNASGKTNLLEALMVICLGGSYRATDSELIMHSKTWSRIDVNTNKGPRTLKLTTNGKTTKEFTIDNKPFKRLSSSHQLPIVLFEPNHLLMLSGSPELRRSYLDEILSLIKPGFKKTRNDYLKTLRQRNALLKSGRANATELFPWNVRLSHLGGHIAQARAYLTDILNKEINKAYRSLSGGNEKLELSYKTPIELSNYESGLLRNLERTAELDLQTGFTAQGPHREDLEILINRKAPASVASRGESRTVTVALKTIEATIINQALGMFPIILLDDVLSELDQSRSGKLLEFVKDHQAVITTTHLATNITNTANIISTA